MVGTRLTTEELSDGEKLVVGHALVVGGTSASYGLRCDQSCNHD